MGPMRCTEAVPWEPGQGRGRGFGEHVHAGQLLRYVEGNMVVGAGALLLTWDGEKAGRWGDPKVEPGTSGEKAGEGGGRSAEEGFRAQLVSLDSSGSVKGCWSSRA